MLNVFHVRVYPEVSPDAILGDWDLTSYVCLPYKPWDNVWADEATIIFVDSENLYLIFMLLQHSLYMWSIFPALYLIF